MEYKLVSIIVPVYNVEKYIGDCLQSIFNQTYKNIEIIIIDDKGNDNSINIVKKMMKFSPFKYSIIEQNENRGVSEARNEGIMRAEGEYIFFLDSDDLISDNCIEVLIENLLNRDADLIIGKFKSFHEVEFPNILNKTLSSKSLNQRYYLKEIYKKDVNKYVWNGLYKKSLIIDNQIFFEKDLKFAEDILWMTLIQFKAKKMFQVDKVTYFYRIYRESASVIIGKNKEYVDNMILIIQKMHYYYKNLKLTSVEKGIIISRIRTFKNGIYSTILSKKMRKSDFNYKILTTVRFNIKDILSSTMNKKEMLIEGSIAMFPIIESYFTIIALKIKTMIQRE